MISERESLQNAAENWQREALRVTAVAVKRQEEIERLREALRELHAVVRGECPSLLDEDSGGDARLDLLICELIDQPAPAPTAGEER